MQKINFFILKHILGLDPYVLKQEKERGIDLQKLEAILKSGDLQCCEKAT